MIHVENLVKTFPDGSRGDVMAVDHVGFSVPPGEVFGLLGSNGAGKTTTLRILCTVLKPTAGIVTVAGHDVIRDADAVRGRIGFLSATTGLYERMTAWEIVTFFGQLNGLSRAALRSRLEDVFELLQMNDFRDVPAARMSTGMKQKVSIARAIIHDPPVLIFDEPTAGLDVLVARTVLESIVRLKGHGKSIVFSTHIMREAEKLCDRIAILHHGRILACGTLLELREKYQEEDLEAIFFRLVS
ncbi:MAG: ABC transporter ATP-binding protein [Gemmataceae bacterium]